MKNVMRLAFFLGLVAAASGEVLLTDDFSGSSLDTTKWRKILPLSTSSISTQISGSLTTMGRGVVATASPMTTAYVLSGTFTPLHSFEHFNVALRSDLSVTNGDAAGERAGVIVTFVVDGPGVSIQQFPATGNWAQLSTAFFRLYSGKAYSFVITDTGSKISVSVNGVEVVSADSTFRAGNYVAFYSREFAYTGSRIDNMTFATIPAAPAPTVVTLPDTSSHLVNQSTLDTGSFSMGFVIRGSTARSVLIRGVGPTLRTFGVGSAATQSTLTLYAGQAVIGTNTAWSSASNATQIAAAATATGAFTLPSGSGDTAILATLNPGSYTAQLAGNGMVLLEVYEVPN